MMNLNFKKHEKYETSIEREVDKSTNWGSPHWSIRTDLIYFDNWAAAARLVTSFPSLEPLKGFSSNEYSSFSEASRKKDSFVNKSTLFVRKIKFE